MDKDRQIRMLIPPFFLLASILWAAYLSGDLGAFLHPTKDEAVLNSAPCGKDEPLTQKSATPNKDDAAIVKSILSVVAVAGVATLPLGYAIGILTLTILGFFSPLFPQRAFDVPVSDEGMRAIWRRLRLPEQPKCRARYGAAVFDHYFVKKPIHEWLFRRWSSFLIASQCVLALVLSIPFAHAFHVRMTCKWLITVVGMIAVFIWQARTAWWEAHHMFELATSVGALSRERPPGGEDSGHDRT